MNCVDTKFSLANSSGRQTPVNVLIVDDDPDFLDLLCSQISQINGVSIDVAATPAEALQFLTHQEYRLIVSDWALNPSTGPDILRKADGLMNVPLRKKTRLASKTPVLFMSGSDKVVQTQVLRTLAHFDPVSFIRKSCGPPLISRLAEQILCKFQLGTEEVPC